MTVTVLVAEDHADNREILCRRLAREKFTVVEAEDGVIAVEAFAAHAPAIVLMDLAMPRMGGMDAMKAIRAAEAGRAVPIIALTAHAMDSVREECIAAGFDAFATKPVDFPALLQTMRALLAARS
ncbi:MAG: response regulator [Hydrogenophilaceae bacterium]|jgi:CheY-like chemotaxis protein|nr:response regulator [Hydrogenophilaceae bacterium]